MPYIGALLGLPTDAERLEVAFAIALRRRKGTPAALEDFAEILTGLTARVVEGWQVTAWTQRLGHPPPLRPVTADFEASTRFRIGTPFEPTRRSWTPSGRFSPRAATAVVWPWTVRTFHRVEAAPLPEARRFALHPLGLEAPLYLKPRSALAGGRRELRARTGDELDAPVRATYRVVQALAAEGQVGYGTNWTIAPQHPLAAVARPVAACAPRVDARRNARCPGRRSASGASPPGGPAPAPPSATRAVVDLHRGHVELGSSLAGTLRATWHRPAPGSLGALASEADADPAARVVVRLNRRLPAGGRRRPRPRECVRQGRGARAPGSTPTTRARTGRTSRSASRRPTGSTRPCAAVLRTDAAALARDRAADLHADGRRRPRARPGGLLPHARGLPARRRPGARQRLRRRRPAPPDDEPRRRRHAADRGRRLGALAHGEPLPARSDPGRARRASAHARPTASSTAAARGSGCAATTPAAPRARPSRGERASTPRSPRTGSRSPGACAPSRSTRSTACSSTGSRSSSSRRAACATATSRAATAPRRIRPTYRCLGSPAPTFASVGFEAAGYYALDHRSRPPAARCGQRRRRDRRLPPSPPGVAASASRAPAARVRPARRPTAPRACSLGGMMIGDYTKVPLRRRRALDGRAGAAGEAAPRARAEPQPRRGRPNGAARRPRPRSAPPASRPEVRPSPSRSRRPARSTSGSGPARCGSTACWPTTPAGSPTSTRTRSPSCRRRARRSSTSTCSRSTSSPPRTRPSSTRRSRRPTRPLARGSGTACVLSPTTETSCQAAEAALEEDAQSTGKLTVTRAAGTTVSDPCAPPGDPLAQIPDGLLRDRGPERRACVRRDVRLVVRERCRRRPDPADRRQPPDARALASPSRGRRPRRGVVPRAARGPARPR